VEGRKESSLAICVHFLPIRQLDVQHIPRRIYHILIATFISHYNQEIHLKLYSVGHCYQMKEAPNLVPMQLPYYFAFYCSTRNCPNNSCVTFADSSRLLISGRQIECRYCFFHATISCIGQVVVTSFRKLKAWSWGSVQSDGVCTKLCKNL
jgi:hypothetical protein